MYTFCSAQNKEFEAMGKNQEMLVEKFMNTSLQYLQGTPERGLYTLVIRCLEVCLRMCTVCVMMQTIMW